MNKKINLLLIIIAANLIWWSVFNSDLFSFWLRLVLAIVLLNLLVLSKQDYNFDFSLFDFFQGVVFAVILYFIFIGGKNLSELIFIGSRSQIMSVYALKEEANLFIITAGLLFIGCGEEIFWRGFLQENLMQEFGSRLGYILASLVYGLVHIWTGNFILVLAALTAGLFWGYLFLRTKSLTMVIISHIVWDILIFIIVPLNF